MADYNSSLPVRSEADADERLQSKIVDFTTPAQGMVVDADGNAHAEMHGNNPAGSDEVLRLSELGAVVPDGVYHATNNSDPGNMGLIAHTRAATPADTDQVKRLTGITNSDVHALDIALHDEDGVPYSESNPLPTYQSPQPGDSIHNYDKEADLASEGTDNHNYTVSASRTLYLTKVLGSSAGKLTIEVQEETASGSGIFTTVAYGYNSVSFPMIPIEFDPPLEVETGKILRVIRKNEDKQATDVHTVIMGTERA